MKKKFRSFEEAQKYVHSLGLKNQKEWRQFARTDKRPKDIPTNPEKVYKNTGWESMGAWLGTGTIAPQLKEYWSFEKAREFVLSLGIKNQRDWSAYCRSGKKLIGIPTSPQKVYRNKGWKNFGDWYGTGMIRHKDRVYWSFEKARDYARKLELKNIKSWRQFAKSGKLPKEIPADPYKVYKNKGWKNFGHWFGTYSVASYLREYWPFEKARDYVQNLKLKSKREWIRYTKSGKLPKEIPIDVRGVYLKKGWKGFGDWLGTGTIQTQLREYWSYEKARDYVHTLKLKSQRGWRGYTKSRTLPKELPTDPEKVYKNKGWKGIGDWLGTGAKRPGDIDYLEFNEAKQIIRGIAKKHKLRTTRDYVKAKKDGLIPENIPAAPWYVYSKENILKKRNKK